MMCRQYSVSPISFLPTALARAEREADLKKYPQSGVTQEKSEDRKGNRHWTQEHATESERDLHFDRLAREEAAKKDAKSDQS
ncbi:hypothetical protein LTS07_008454 [Exophiala sideris]|uniref:Uncharacterized protein n=1 Tax=Exophiala sideris TaxID=1016849 RepID=A0ABR0J1V4_9EURO|nr:hypothetical protein LTS07_008454 [Exophiala sideris]KAK5030701.1 hypothetical protein LTR13_008055 [Exophiala sideris]KAK5054241.1 hypothetical protein LTR69_008856 [Exophiala sideris]KAK5179643.1 hypothetical protein LTR44_007811 [Eurotiomycetes sp. CCFEE 6388]